MRAILGLLVAVTVGSVAQAAPVLVTGSTYNATLFSTPNNVLANPTLTVNGTPQNFTYGGVLITATLTETALGGNDYRITVQFSSASDMFPSPADTGFFGIGLFGNPFDFLSPVTLNSVIATYINGAGGIVASGDLGGLVPVGNRSPWNGVFVSSPPNIVGAFTNTGGQNVRTLTAQFNVTVIPEPATVVVFGGLALAGAVGFRRRKAGA